MYDDFDIVASLRHCLGIANVEFDELDPVLDGDKIRQPAGREIVDDRDFVPVIDEELCCVRADKSRSACDQDFHRSYNSSKGNNRQKHGWNG